MIYMIGQKLEKIITPKDTHLHAVEFAGMGYESFDQNIQKYIKHLGKKHTTETTSFRADIESDYDDTIESSAGQILELIETDISHGHHTELALRWHSLGWRTLMHTLLRYPEILDHTREITLIHIPLHLDIFPWSQIQKIFSRKWLHFSDNFLRSLAVDTLDINEQFIALLREKWWKWDISAVSDREDTTLMKLYGLEYSIRARDFAEQLREFHDVVSHISEKKKIVGQIISKSNPMNIPFNRKIPTWHNAENIIDIREQVFDKKLNNFLAILLLTALLQIPESHIKNSNYYEESINNIPSWHSTWAQVF